MRANGLADYCRQSKVSFDEDPDLGFIPRLQKDTDAKPLIEKIAGQFMGANLKKGRTFLWLLAHARDGNGHAIPRALVRLIEESAVQERERPLASYNRLLDPEAFAGRWMRSQENMSFRSIRTNCHGCPVYSGVCKGRVSRWIAAMLSTF